jgi:hypothetical protein
MPRNCFSYFVTENIWNKRPTEFLSSLCRQMKAALGRSDEADNIDIELERLKNIFANLAHQV